MLEEHLRNPHHLGLAIVELLQLDFKLPLRVEDVLDIPLLELLLEVTDGRLNLALQVCLRVLDAVDLRTSAIRPVELIVLRYALGTKHLQTLHPRAEISDRLMVLAVTMPSDNS